MAGGLKRRVFSVLLVALALSLFTLRSAETQRGSTALHVFGDAQMPPPLSPTGQVGGVSESHLALEDVRSSLRGFLDGVESHLTAAPPSHQLAPPAPITPFAQPPRTANDHVRPLAGAAAPAAARTDLEWCTRMAARHGIVPGSSWGTATIEQAEWVERNCNRHVARHSMSEERDESGIDHQRPMREPPQSPLRAQDARPAALGLPSPASPASAPAPPKNPDADWCRQALWKHDVRPGSSWGSLGEKDKIGWRKRDCDNHITTTASFVDTNSLPQCGADAEGTSTTARMVAVCCGTTTRKVKGPQLAKLALFRYLLPSMARTVDCGLDYMAVVGYDKGDPFYDSLHGKLQVENWFDEFIEKPMAARGITVKLHLVQVDNKLKKPGPVFNVITKYAYDKGADYIYRVNDDTEMKGPWAKRFIEELHKMGEPYGAVGPLCQQGNRKILTHDFTHRTHMEIFNGLYYPKELVDWWMDDWISRVYGSRRTRQGSSVPVVHHTQAHGQRYNVDKSNKQHLERLLTEGKSKIISYMKDRKIDEKVIAGVSTDRFNGFPFQKF